ncbi:hypothetical protein GCM10023322_83960 [Rugosimonospora acidiphila]|uniref:ChrB N-terminal domain-containing protein n=1 Tax=Rugosimonospora acidiphila TaxID=556531 RepID=A0ABP9SW12_9ACTN
MLLVHRVLPEPARLLRTSVWRRVKGPAAIYPQNSTAGLPDATAAERTLRTPRKEITETGGTAYLLSTDALPVEANRRRASNAARDDSLRKSSPGRLSILGLTNGPGRLRRWLGTVAAGVVMLTTSACGSPAGTPLPTVAPARPVASTTPPPADRIPEHVVVVVFENKGIGQIIGTGKAPAFDAVARQGVLYAHSYAITHPSQPNYLALFSGSTQGVTDDSCPHTFTTMNLARQLLDAGRTFTGYAEALPHSGFLGCGEGRYARKHAPWTDFADLPATVSQPYTAFPSDFNQLPSVAFVAPDLCDDMHDCSIATGNRWFADHLSGYATWAQTHHSLLIVTFDEDDSVGANIIPTIIAGQGVAPARASDRIDHYTLLRTIEACFGLVPLGVAAARAPLASICR